MELKEAIDHRCFVVIEHDDEEDEDDNDEYAIDKTLEIVLIPETDAEKMALMEQHYFSQEKEQVVVQYIKRSLLEYTETLVDWPSGQ